MFTVAGLFPLKPEMSVRDRNQTRLTPAGQRKFPTVQKGLEGSQEGTSHSLGGFNLIAPLRNPMIRLCFPASS